MIRHIVMFELKDEYEGRGKNENMSLAKRTLESLADIEWVDQLSVHINKKSDPWSKEIDIVLEAEFENIEKLKKYQDDTLYQKSIDIVKPLRKNRWVVDYEI